MSDLLAEHSDEIDQVATAMSVAQEDFRVIDKTHSAKIKGRTYRYANLTECIESTREALAKRDLVVLQPLERIDGYVGVCTMLVHGKSGQWIKSHSALIPEEPGARAGGMTISYMRRYGYCSMLGLTMEDNDAQTSADEGSSKPAGASPAEIAQAIASIDKQKGGYKGFIESWKGLRPEIRDSEQVKAQLEKWKQDFPPEGE